MCIRGIFSADTGNGFLRLFTLENARKVVLMANPFLLRKLIGKRHFLRSAKGVFFGRK